MVSIYNKVKFLIVCVKCVIFLVNEVLLTGSIVLLIGSILFYLKKFSSSLLFILMLEPKISLSIGHMIAFFFLTFKYISNYDYD